MKILATLIIIFALFFSAQMVLAEDYGLEKTRDAAGLSKGSVEGIAGNVIGAGLTMVGVLFLVLMIYGGIRWMLARGNEQSSQKALDTITAAVIGLLIVVASYAVTNFVFKAVKGEGTTSGMETSTSELE